VRVTVSLHLDALLLDAKTAILREHLDHFYSLQQDGTRQEAVKQAYTTVSCAADILKDVLRILDQISAVRPSPPDMTLL
jgi:hypothetical protein